MEKYRTLVVQGSTSVSFSIECATCNRAVEILGLPRGFEQVQCEECGQLLVVEWGYRAGYVDATVYRLVAAYDVSYEKERTQ